MFPNRVSMEREASSPEPIVYSFINIRQSPQLWSPHEKQGKHTVAVHRAPRARKAYIQWGAAWFPKGIVYDIAISTPVPFSLQRDAFHLDLDRSELR